MAGTTDRQEQKKKQIRKAARALLRDPLFLHRAMRKIGELGVVGEKKNRLVLFLAGLTKDHGHPVSVLVKGSTSGGKSNLIREAVRLFPPESIITLASLSQKALAFGDEPLDGHILYIYEYRGMKDAQFLIRLQQSEGVIAHEYATVAGRHRGTAVSRRTGFPVVLTATTRDRVFADDETRFLSVSIDESAKQTLAILKSEFKGTLSAKEPPLPVWHEAVRLIGKCKRQVVFPDWFEYVAGKLPVDQVRVRRDWRRFLSFCKTIAICRSWSQTGRGSPKITFAFSDYCFAYKILASAFESTVHELPKNELHVAEAVQRKHAKFKRAVTVQELAAVLGWRDKQVYKHVARAVKHSLIKYEDGTKPRNLKRLLPVPGLRLRFLPTPESVFESNRQIGETASFIDPISGREKTFSRPRNPQKPLYSRRAV